MQRTNLAAQYLEVLAAHGVGGNSPAESAVAPKLSWADMPEGKEKYNAYLASREWWEKRRAVERRCKGVCERCKIWPLNHVHHRTYIRKYAELLEDLEALCIGCHEFEHAKRDTNPADCQPFDSEWKARFLATLATDGGFRKDVIRILGRCK